MTDRILFGPSGNSQSFYDQGHQNSFEMPAWLREMGLDCYEYSCGKSVNIRPETAQKIGEAAGWRTYRSACTHLLCQSGQRGVRKTGGFPEVHP
jgi:hypothetical protein